MIHSAHALPPDTQLGNYRLIESIGRGGFGITYMAWDIKLERTVVLKECYPQELCKRDESTGVIHPLRPEWQDAYETALAALQREARLLAAQNHEHIMRVYEVFESHGSIFYVMPYLEGGSLLGKMLQAEQSKVPIDAKLALSWLRDILSALNYLHTRQLYHRDIKPSNILFDENDRPILIDFGAALNLPEVTRSITQGVFTLAYAAPEQIIGKGEIGPWTDYYALAATWYRLLSGLAVERADARFVQDSLLPLAKYPQSAVYARTVLAAIEQNLSLNAGDRYQTYQEWMQALDGIPRPRQTRALTRNYAKWLRVIMLSLLAISGITWFLSRDGEIKQEQSVTPRQEEQSTELFSTKKLDQIDDMMALIQGEWIDYRSDYEDALDDLKTATIKRLEEEANAVSPNLTFDEAEFEALRTDILAKWKSLNSLAVEYRKEHDAEILRIRATLEKLSEEEKKMQMLHLSLIIEMWESNYKYLFSTKAAPKVITNSYLYTYPKVKEEIDQYYDYAVKGIRAYINQRDK